MFVNGTSSTSTCIKCKWARQKTRQKPPKANKFTTQSIEFQSCFFRPLFSSFFGFVWATLTLGRELSGFLQPERCTEIYINLWTKYGILCKYLTETRKTLALPLATKSKNYFGNLIGPSTWGNQRKGAYIPLLVPWPRVAQIETPLIRSCSFEWFPNWKITQLTCFRNQAPNQCYLAMT